jgi:tetratricopeptide (TPR) repeat protein
MEIKNKLEKAIEFHQQNNFNEAKKVYEEIIEINPNIAEVHHNLGILLKSFNKLDEAEESFSKSILLKPNFAISHYQMGNTKYKLQKFKDSEYCYEKAISLKSNFLEAYINLGRAQRELRKFKEAEESLRNANKINPDFPEVNTLLGLILFDRGRLSDDLQHKNLDKLNEAKKLLLKSINQNPNYSISHLNLGLVYQEFGELNDAKESFQKSLKLDPSSNYAKNNLDILLNQIKFLDVLGVKNAKKDNIDPNFLKTFNKIPFITHRKPNANLIDLLYKLNSTELNKTKGGPLYGNGKTSNYSLLENDNLVLKELKKDLVDIIKKEINSDIFFIDSFFNILSAGGGSVPHHHLNNFDKTFNLDQQKYSLTYYLSVGDQNCNEPGIFKLYEPDEEVLPSEGMIMIIPSGRKHSAVYEGKKDRLMIGINFYIYK